MMSERSSMPLIEVVNLGVRLNTSRGPAQAVRGVSFALKRGETLGLVGESGCGKSTLVRALTRLLDPTAGTIRFSARDLSLVPARDFAHDRDRGRIQMVFQDAGESINPRFTAFDAIADPVRRLKHLSGAALVERVDQAARQCGLPLELLGRYPHQLSGGQRADRIVVMHAGHVVENAATRELIARPGHPYTAELIAATPDAAMSLDALASIPGSLPDLRRADLPPCRYSERCPRKTDLCDQPLPHPAPGSEHFVACWNPL